MRLFSLREKLEKLRKHEGATMVEYALIVALIAIVAALTLGPLGDSIRGVFSEVEAEL